MQSVTSDISALSSSTQYNQGKFLYLNASNLSDALRGQVHTINILIRKIIFNVNNNKGCTCCDQHTVIFYVQ